MSQSNSLCSPQFILESTSKSLTGVAIAFGIIGLWCINLIMGLSLDLSTTAPAWIVILMMIQAFLYTGLFITAHDAMHRSLIPKFPKLNDQIGSLAVFLYLFFSYQKLLKNHWLHHRHPASDKDPDFHDGQHKHPIFWYLSFIKRYFGWQQVAGISITYCGAQSLLNISEYNLFLFWIVPSIISSLQLFFFGTYLPHRELPAGYDSPHRARSNNFTTLLSFLSCYHFGYHVEHHEYPAIPWWQLPTTRKLRLENLATAAPATPPQ